MLSKYETQVALEKLRDVRQVEKEAVKAFDATAEQIFKRLLMEAAVNHMTVQDVARHSGYTQEQIKRRMKAMNLDRTKGKRLLAESAAKALTENSELLGVDPFAIMNSPMAYLPMGEALRQELMDSQVARVTELDGDPEDYTVEYLPVSGNDYHDLHLRARVELRVPCPVCGKAASL